MSRLAMLTALVSLALVSSLAAQGSYVLAEGSRVRVRTGDIITGRVTVGTLARLTGDSLEVRPEGGGTPFLVARQSVTRLEVSTGTTTNAGKGAIIGVLPGALVGFLAGEYSELAQCLSCSSSAPVTGALLGAAAGAVVGALIGSSHHSDRWMRVAVSSVHGTVGKRGPGVSLSLNF